MPEPIRIAIDRQIKEREAVRHRIQELQGFGKEIISDAMGDTRFVVVGNDVFHLKNCKTFHDFLLRYITTIFGTEWWENQDKVHGKSRHTLLRWRDLAMKQLTQGRIGVAADVVHNIPFTGALSAYMHLAHNLYLLAHNVELQKNTSHSLKKL